MKKSLPIGVDDFKSLLQADSASIRGLAIIMELKVADDFSEMEAGCIQALNQIETRKYSMELEMEGYKDIIKYGICFYKKNVWS